MKVKFQDKIIKLLIQLNFFNFVLSFILSHVFRTTAMLQACFFCFLFFFLFSPSPHFSRNPRIRFFWFFASTLVSGNVKRWRFWIFEENSKFGHFGQFLVKNGQFWPKMAYFGYFSKTAHQILIIFCIKLSDIVRNWKLLFGTLGKL